MRKIILNLATSLDCMIEDADGAFDWCFTDQDYGMTEFLDSIDTIFYGRKSYQLLLEMGDNSFADNKRYVFSNNLTSVEPGWNLIGGNLEKQVNEIRNQPGKDIWMFGGASLITTFINAGWIDEYLVSVHPIVLSGGKPLFEHLDGRLALDLIDCKTYDSGLVQLRYKPKG